MSDLIPDPVLARGLAFPDRPALAGLESLSYGGLHEQARTVARALRQRGLTHGDVVAWRLGVSAAAAAVVLGAWRAGLTVAPLSPRLPPAALAERLAHVGAAALVAHPDADTARLGIPVLAPAALFEAGGPLQPVPDWDLDRAATLVFTSGSSGAPKAVLHTLGNHVWSARGVNEALEFGPNDRWLLALPLDHVGGLGVLVRCWLAGGAAVLAEPGGDLAAAIHEGAVTHASLVPTQLRRLLDGGFTPPGSLRAILLGGSAVPPDLLDAAQERGLPVRPSYGMTEMTSTVAIAPEDDPHGPYAVLPHREVRITEEGEVAVRGPVRFAGTLRPAARGQALGAEAGGLDTPFDADGWFHTGDLGTLDAEGLRITGRKDRMFISGGENVQPEAIERALLALPGVARASVVPVADAEFGHRPVAFVATTSGEAPDLDALRGALGRTLPRFMLPVAALSWPEDADGPLKVDRQRLERLAAQALA